MEFFVISEKYTYSRVKNCFLPHHEWWGNFFYGSLPQGAIPHMAWIDEIFVFCNIGM